jgi:hypothetical protein
MEFLKIININDVYYYALNTIDDQCVVAFKNHLIHQDIALLSNYYNKITIQANIDQIITNIRNFFFNQSGSNNTYKTKEILDIKTLNKIVNEAKKY